MSHEEVKKIALSFPESIESPHFEKTSIRVRKKIFATVDLRRQTLVVKLSVIDQSVFCDMLPALVRPVPGGWGKKGWTEVEYIHLDKEALTDLMKTAYCEVAPKSLLQ